MKTMEIFRFYYRCTQCGSRTEMEYIAPDDTSWVQLPCKECETHILSILKSPEEKSHPASFIVKEATNDDLVFPIDLACEVAFVDWIRDHQGDKFEE